MILAVNPVGAVRIYFEALAPESVQVTVTDFPLPTFLSENTADCITNETTSGETTPTNVPPEAEAVVLPLYCLSLTVIPVAVIVNLFTVIVTVAVDEQPVLLEAVTEILYVPGVVEAAMVSTPVDVFIVIPVGNPVAEKLLAPVATTE